MRSWRRCTVGTPHACASLAALDDEAVRAQAGGMKAGRAIVKARRHFSQRIFMASIFGHRFSRLF